jgi:hypothetical protein
VSTLPREPKLPGPRAPEEAKMLLASRTLPPPSSQTPKLEEVDSKGRAQPSSCSRCTVQVPEQTDVPCDHPFRIPFEQHRPEEPRKGGCTTCMSPPDKPRRQCKASSTPATQAMEEARTPSKENIHADLSAPCSPPNQPASRQKLMATSHAGGMVQLVTLTEPDKPRREAVAKRKKDSGHNSKRLNSHSKCMDAEDLKEPDVEAVSTHSWASSHDQPEGQNVLSASAKAAQSPACTQGDPLCTAHGLMGRGPAAGGRKGKSIELSKSKKRQRCSAMHAPKRLHKGCKTTPSQEATEGSKPSTPSGWKDGDTPQRQAATVPGSTCVKPVALFQETESQNVLPRAILTASLAQDACRGVEGPGSESDRLKPCSSLRDSPVLSEPASSAPQRVCPAGPCCAFGKCPSPLHQDHVMPDVLARVKVCKQIHGSRPKKISFMP